ncbi:MAG: glutamate synthase subunit beta [Candidatus Sumerlaeia bacterium]|nr:glutamate synthase subunit beta [Candidatus Sumerlaeia bacterium]
MGKPTGFMEIPRETLPSRPVEDRVNDWKEIYLDFPEEKQKAQGARCMDCGVPFCNQGCPLGNLIPDWNDHVYRGRWKEAIDSLHKTNNFPEFTGRICPAPCEGSCVLGIIEPPVSIKLIEVSIVDRAFKEGWIKPEPPAHRTGKKVAVIGSGPAGLAAAAQLNKAGHTVTVYERAPRVGGLLTFGIPDFKLEKHVVDRRVDLLREEGITFRTSCNIGVDITMDEIRGDADAVVLACGSTQPRDLNIPGRELKGVHFAMDFLTAQNHLNYGDLPDWMTSINVKDRNVIIIGGGDTGADCLGTSHRQGAASIAQFEIVPRPPEERAPDNMWPEWPRVFRVSSAHEEGGKREYSINTKKFIGDDKGHVKALITERVEWTKDENGRHAMKPVPGSEETWPAEAVFLAMGFVHPEKPGPIEQLGLELNPRGNVKADDNYMTSAEGVFAAGDMRRGQSLVVWAIAEGRKAARGVDAWLMGTSDLPG